MRKTFWNMIFCLMALNPCPFEVYFASSMTKSSSILVVLLVFSEIEWNEVRGWDECNEIKGCRRRLNLLAACFTCKVHVCDSNGWICKKFLRVSQQDNLPSTQNHLLIREWVVSAWYIETNTGRFTMGFMDWNLEEDWWWWWVGKKKKNHWYLLRVLSYSAESHWERMDQDYWRKTRTLATMDGTGWESIDGFMCTGFSGWRVYKVFEGGKYQNIRGSWLLNPLLSISDKVESFYVYACVLNGLPSLEQCDVTVLILLKRRGLINIKSIWENVLYTQLFDACSTLSIPHKYFFLWN